MKLEQAVEMIYKLHAEKLSNPEIARRLEKAGYKSERTGKPVGALAVGYHLKKNLPPKPAPEAPIHVSADTKPKATPTVSPQFRRQAKNPSEKKLEMVVEFLASKEVPLKERCEIAATILLS